MSYFLCIFAKLNLAADGQIRLSVCGLETSMSLEVDNRGI